MKRSMARKAKLLEKLGKGLKDMNLDDIEELDIDVLKEMTIIMKDVQDYRGSISYQSIENIIMIVFIGLLANCNEWTEIYNLV